MIPAALLTPLIGVASNVIDKIFPDKSKAEKMKAEFAIQVQKLDHKETKDFYDFVVSYEGEGNQVHKSIQILRGSVRPVLTYFLAGAYVYGFLNPHMYSPEIMTGLFQLNIISLGFWYGERALKNLGLNLKKGD